MSNALLLLIGLVIGAAAGVGIGLLRGRQEGARQAAQLGEEAAGLNATLHEVRGQLTVQAEELTAARARLEEEKIAGTRAKARLEAAQQSLDEQRQQLAETDKRMRDAFTALSATALKNSGEQFISLAEARLKPLREQLERYEKQIAELEKARSEAYGGLSKHINTLEERSNRLGQETNALVAALRDTRAKGRWGEISLQRIVELAGMSEHCDFAAQQHLESGQRPDLVVHLPGGRILAIDSKVNTSAYLDALQAAEEAEQKRLLEKYARDVRATLKALGAKEYWRQFSPAPEMVVMFVPGEAFFAAALSHDRDLIIDGIGMGVLPASPTTLIALLYAIRHGWQQQQMAENAERIAAAGRELYGRLCKFTEHLDGIRVGLDKAGKAYNDAVGSWERRALPAAQKLSELGAAEPGKALTELSEIDASLRFASSGDDRPAEQP